MADSNHGGPALPDDVLTEILARLPAKSAGRFRCVSRAWRAKLSSDYFVELHARLANRPDHPRLLLTPVGSSYDFFIYSWRPGGAVEKLMPDDFGGGGVVVPLTKPCRGLVLIEATIGGGYFVCNPSTGESFALPDSQAPLKMTIRQKKLFGPELVGPEPPWFLRVSYGLGYCASSKEYKVVRLFSVPAPQSEDDIEIEAATCCEVFVLDALGYWRPSAESPPLCSVRERNPAVFLNGYLHFLCCGSGTIITFNISDENFSSLPLPPSLENVVPLLTELDGCLCVCCGEPNSEDPYNVYLLRGYKEVRWEKACSLDRTAWPESERFLLKSLWIAPLCVYYSNGGQKNMFGTGNCRVFATDLDGGNLEILFSPDDTIVGTCEDDSLPVLGLFEESLVPVSRIVEDMIFSSPMTEAWFDILKWLPTRSILKLKLVCREWHGMIMSDCFIQSHAIHANLNRSPQIMFIIDARFGRYIDMGACVGEDALQPEHGIVCSQPCHGLNVGSCDFWDFVCNPTIGYYQHIEFDDKDGTFFAGRIGLGYNMKIDKHILVHITYKEKNFETRHYELQCQVRYVNEQRWHLIDPPSRPIADIPPTFVDGKIYWIVEPNLGPVSAGCEIVAFNVNTDKFEALQGPPCSHDSERLTILQLQSVLCIACSDQSRNMIYMWMMKDIGIWSMEYHIVLDKLSKSTTTTPLADDPKDGRILLNTGWSLGYYDPKTASFEAIYTKEARTPEVEFFPIVCHESLVCPLL